MYAVVDCIRGVSTLEQGADDGLAQTAVVLDQQDANGVRHDPASVVPVSAAGSEKAKQAPPVSAPSSSQTRPP